QLALGGPAADFGSNGDLRSASDAYAALHGAEIARWAHFGYGVDQPNGGHVVLQYRPAQSVGAPGVLDPERSRRRRSANRGPGDRGALRRVHGLSRGVRSRTGTEPRRSRERPERRLRR